jgi:hypothetical protein
MKELPTSPRTRLAMPVSPAPETNGCALEIDLGPAAALGEVFKKNGVFK